MSDSKIEVRRIAGALGAVIEGVDLSKELDGAVHEQIRRALHEHLVIFFRGQDLSSEKYLAFARRFGEPAAYPMLEGEEGFPEITHVVKLEHERVNFGGLWHSDTVYLDQPPMGTLLLARELPPLGGDTLFANQYLAYEALSPGMRKLLAGLTAVNSSSKAGAAASRENRVRESALERKAFTSEHPAVITHDETGRKALFVNFGHTVRFKDMTTEESAPLLDFLFQHQVKPEFTCRFSWEPGSLAFWDNRASQHNPVNDYHGHKRVLHRITLAGGTPR